MTIVHRGMGIGGGLVAGLVALSCVGERPSDEDCEKACSLASRCGLLPSALGGVPGRGQLDNEADCVARCLASDGDTREVRGLLEVLTSDDFARPDTTPLCDSMGVMACEELIETLEETSSTRELEITTTVELSMVSAISHASNFEPEHWCCFDFAGELSNEEGAGGTMASGELAPSEVEAVQEIIVATHACFTRLEDRIVGLMPLLMPPMPGEPERDPEQVSMQCTALGEVWKPMDDPMEDPMDGPDLEADPCYFARKSIVLQRLDVPGVAEACTFDAVVGLDMLLRETQRRWHLDGGDYLVDGDGNVRSTPEIEDQLETAIRDEVTRPGGFVADVCEELDLEAGGDACAVDIDELQGVTCEVGPPCSAADCLLDSPACDRTLCDADVSPPGRDCGFFGIESVTLGYRTDEGVEILGEPILGCSSRTVVTTVFEDVKVGVIVPVAVVEGTLPTSFLPDGGEVADDGSFRWYVEGEPRWVSAGEARLQIPSPLLEHTIYRYEDPLEFLGWVLPRVPRGRGCDDQPLLCETLSNGNCDDGIDNDGDGFADGATPWCDELFFELVQRCVVTEPGRQPHQGCRGEQ